MFIIDFQSKVYHKIVYLVSILSRNFMMIAMCFWFWILCILLEKSIFLNYFYRKTTSAYESNLQIRKNFFIAHLKIDEPILMRRQWKLLKGYIYNKNRRNWMERQRHITVRRFRPSSDRNIIYSFWDILPKGNLLLKY